MRITKFEFVDNFLNSITMYRLVLYYLIFLLFVALVYSFFGILPFGPIALVFSTVFLVAACFLFNKIFEKVFEVQINVESLYITALILALIITPVGSFSGIGFLFLAAFLAMVSKYILAIHKKHVFNPVAIAVSITGFTIHGYASWWVGTLVMFPFILLGVLIVRKIRRSDLVFYFLISSLVTILVTSFLRGGDPVLILRKIFVETPVLFFAFVMLTEPLTTPPTKLLQGLYGGLVGILFFPLTPEIALSVGNVFSYIVSPKEKLSLRLKKKVKMTSDIYDFVFEIPHKLNFRAGQYMEWTLGHNFPDSRGNRRYFTIASSPTENNLRIGVKFPLGKSSSFKKTMLSLKGGDEIIATQLAGDFTLPNDDKKKLVFIAGGIGITPFRSIIKYLLDRGEKRDIVLVYSEKTTKKMVYKDVFDEARKSLGIKVFYVATEREGHVDAKKLKQEVPDFKERLFYISGSDGVVSAFEKLLKEMGVAKAQVKTDYFPGF